ncbi:cyclin-H [Ditylenchus destructor]|nr:cyclin-H [Ditylenchus destructor]
MAWTFPDQEEINKLRTEANGKYRSRYLPFLENGDQQNDFLTAAEELLLCRIVTETGIRFGDDFRPALWPSARWIAFAYFKRFYLNQSAMEYFPKNVMMACYYLAAKIDEFNVSIDQFVDNLRNGVRENNIETILTLEPELMLKLNYHLTVHCPFRPFEGHLIDMKTKCILNFDLEIIRSHCTEFFKRALVGDAMLMFPPSQIALAAIKYGLEKTDKSPDVLRDYLVKLLEFDSLSLNADDAMMLDKLQLRIDVVCDTIRSQAMSMKQEQSGALQAKMQRMVALQQKLDPLIKPIEKSNEPVDSDDDF